MIDAKTGLRKVREAALVSVLEPGSAIQRLPAACAILARIDLSREISDWLRPELQRLIGDFSALASSPMDKKSELVAQQLIERLHRCYARFRAAIRL